ncbi:tRNA lysidine(34) synthetase TilS [Rugosimonospora acidiphila]
MAALSPAVAACRLAVRQALAGVQPGGLVLAACSGGADSLALASALAFVAPRSGRRAGLITVDHGLQVGSAERAAEVACWAGRVGLEPAVAVPVTVDGAGGPEAAARAARYEALAGTAARLSAVAVLLGHTRDDQAETVLLALARGGGPRGIAGMRNRRIIDGVPFIRPFLAVSRAQTRAACTDLGLSPWEDPHNADPAYARSRLRAALPVLVDTLGPDLVDNLARTARLVAADVEALDALAASAGTAATEPDGSLDVAALTGLPAAVRTRVLRDLALRLGAPGAALSSIHIDALDALVTDWHGQGPVSLPGGIEVGRRGHRLAAHS